MNHPSVDVCINPTKQRNITCLEEPQYHKILALFRKYVLQIGVPTIKLHKSVDLEKGLCEGIGVKDMTQANPPPPVGHSNGKRGYQARPWTHKKHPYHIFFRYENRPYKRLFACIFLTFVRHVLSKICLYDQKHTLFSNFARFCTPKRCTCVKCLMSLIPPHSSAPPPRDKNPLTLILKQVKWCIQKRECQC